MDETRRILRHFLAALAYRTQKALHDGPADFADFQAGGGARTPRELVRHMASVLGYAAELGIDQPLPAAPTPASLGRVVDIACRFARWRSRRAQVAVEK